MISAPRDKSATQSNSAGASSIQGIRATGTERATVSEILCFNSTSVTATRLHWFRAEELEADCASPGYLERFGIPANVSDLETRHKVVGYFSAATGEAWPLRFRHRAGEKQVHNFDIAANDSASLINMLVHGMGIGQTHASVAKSFIESGQLIPVLGSSTNTQFPVSIIYPPTKQLNVRLRIFIDWMVERLSG